MPSSTAPARFVLLPGVRLHLIKKRERALLLHRVFLKVSARREAGESLRSALTRYLHQLKRRHYHCDPTSRVSGVSRSTLTRLYWHWIKNSKTHDCLKWRYRIGEPIGQDQVARFVRGCASPGVFSMAAGYRGSGCSTAWRRLSESLAPELRAALRRLHGERRALLRQLARNGVAIERLAIS